MKADLRCNYIDGAKSFNYVMEKLMFSYLVTMRDLISKENFKELIQILPNILNGDAFDLKNITFNPNDKPEKLPERLESLIDYHAKKNKILFGSSKPLLLFLDEANMLKSLSENEADRKFLKGVLNVLVQKCKQEEKISILFATTDSFLPLILETTGLMASSFFNVVSMGHLNGYKNVFVHIYFIFLI
jgi:hypothetical protein